MSEYEIRRDRLDVVGEYTTQKRDCGESVEKPVSLCAQYCIAHPEDGTLKVKVVGSKNSIVVKVRDVVSVLDSVGVFE